MPEAALTGLGSRRRSRRLFAAGVVLVGALALVAVAAPWLTAYDPDAIVVASYHGPLAPEGAHPLGTDTLGRDVWARLAHGARTSLFVGGLAMVVSFAIGMTVGLAAGYFGGLVDAGLMWLVDLVLTMPSLLLLIVLATIFPPSILTIPLVIGAIGWTTFARTVRGDVLSLRERDYVQAALALGASDARIILRHLLPGVLPGAVVLAALRMSGAIVVDAGLSYLGLGVQPPTPSWGNMIASGRDTLVNAPWVASAPGVALVLVVVACTLLGDALRDALDPNVRR